MIQTLYQRVKDAFSGFSWPHDRTERPPSRLGCVDVDVFVTPRDEDDVTFLRRVKELKQLQKQDREPTTALLDYFADRFERLEIGRIVGCPFDTYLQRPLVVEEIRNDLASTNHS